MTDARSPIAALPEPHDAAGAVRTVGVELEFGGLRAHEAASVIAATVGGEVEMFDDFGARVATMCGTFEVELDSRWAHPGFVQEKATDLPDGLEQRVATSVSQAAGTVLRHILPVELVCPPIPYDRIDRIRSIVRALAAAGALGTRHAIASGFGMHLNIAAARLSVEHLLATMRAYCLLDFWLRREGRIAVIRQVQVWIEPFSEAYKRHILRPDYAPSLTGFIDDHLAFNPTRNKELDLLPMFALIDPERVAMRLPGVKNSPRPTWHWRLPNSRIDEPDWDPVADWNRWATVETLASDREALAGFGAAYLSHGPQSEIDARLRRLADSVRWLAGSDEDWTSPRSAREAVLEDINGPARGRDEP